MVADMKKQCFKCGEYKDINDFYTHPQMADGHLGKCKECTKKDSKERSVLRPDIIREYEKKRSETDKRKKHASEHMVKWREKYPERYKAHNTLNNAIRDGRIKKPTRCEICDKPSRLHGHHYDYTMPLDVIWMCEECHGQIQ